MIKQFIFYKEWWECLRDFPDSERLKFYDAIMEYAFTGQEPSEPMTGFGTSIIRQQIERDQLKYELRCLKNKEAVERRWCKNRQK